MLVAGLELLAAVGFDADRERLLRLQPLPQAGVEVLPLEGVDDLALAAQVSAGGPTLWVAAVHVMEACAP